MWQLLTTLVSVALALCSLGAEGTAAAGPSIRVAYTPELIEIDLVHGCPCTMDIYRQQKDVRVRVSGENRGSVLSPGSLSGA